MTKPKPFYNDDGVQIGQVNMMFGRSLLAYARVTDLGCQVLELPYAGSRIKKTEFGITLSMIIVLPRKGLSLTEAIGKVYEFGMNKIYRELKKAKLDEEVEVRLPRFEISSSLDLKESLEVVSDQE